MTLMADLAGHDLWLEFQCGRVVKIACEDVAATSTDEVFQKAVCSECGVKLALSTGLRVVRSLERHRTGGAADGR